MKEHYEHLHANKLDYLEEIEKILERHALLRLTQEETDNQNRSIKSKEIESIIKKIN